MMIARQLALTLLATIALSAASPAHARRSNPDRHYAIRCVGSECSDRYHYRTPRGERSHHSSYGRSRRSHY